MAEDQTPEYTQAQMIMEAQRVASNIAEVYAGKERTGVVLLALHMLVAQMGIQQGNSLADVMQTLAGNVPLFYKKIHEAKIEQSRPKIIL
jgi:hypothetical protein